LFQPSALVTQVIEQEATSETIAFDLSGDGLYNGRVGDTMEFSISTKTKGQLTDLNLNQLQAYCTGAGKKLNLNITRTQKGKYDASFRVDQPGQYHVVVKYKPDDSWHDVIDQTVNVSEGTSGGYLYNIPRAQIRSHSPVNFNIQSTDSMGNKVLSGGDEWQATSNGPSKVEKLLITDLSDGTYSCEIIFPSTGNYTIQILLDGKREAKESPLKFSVV